MKAKLHTKFKKDRSLPTLLLWLAVPLCTGCTAQDPWQHEYDAGVKSFASHNFLEAEVQLKKASGTAFSAHNTIELADALTMLARVYSEQGKVSAAKPVLRHALNMYREQLGPDSQRVALALNELASCLHEQSEFAQAEMLCQEALAINEKAFGPDANRVASTVNNLAQIYQKQGRKAEAEPLLLRAVAIYGKNQKDGPTARMLIASLNNLAVFYQKQGRLDEARQAAEKALALQRKTFGDNSAGVGVELATLAAIERSDYNFELAAQHYREAIAILQTSEHDFEEVLCETNDLYADLLLNQKEYARAEPVYLTALTHCRRAHGPKHPCVAERLDDLAQLYRRTGRFKEAEAALKEALEINRSSYDSDSAMVATSMNELSAVFVDQGKFDQAQQVYADWVPTLKKLLGPQHPRVADALQNWAMVATKAQDSKRAQELLAQAKVIRSHLVLPTVNP